MATKYTPKELEEHLCYEIDLLNHTYSMLPKIKTYLSCAGADERIQTLTLYALMDAFCLHARQLIEFFSKKGKENCASSFTKSIYKPPNQPKGKLEQKLNNQVAHLMDGRTTVEAEKISDQERIEMMQWLYVAIKEFKSCLASPYDTISISDVDQCIIVKDTLGATNMISSS